VGNVTAYDATWGPDGKTIVYSDGHNVFSIKRDGVLNRRFFTLDGLVSSLRFSPNGRVLRFTLKSEAHQSTALWEASADGSNPHPLLPAWNRPAAECCGSWTADGRYFVFQSERQGHKNIWTMREKNGFPQTGPMQLTAGPMNFSDPILARDGKHLFVIGTLPRVEIVRFDVRTREFVPYLLGVSGEGLDFSRNGEFVTYTSYPDGALWRSKLDGSEKRQLTFPPLRAFLPRWSPDGKQIAFMAMSPESEWKLNIVSAEGGISTQLFANDEDEADPTWSPDGNSIVFGRGPWTKLSAVDIRIVSLKTRQVVTVAGSDGLFSPRWSPDGRYIVALTLKQPYRPVLLDLKTGKWEQLLNTNVGYPSWSHDGRYLYFQDWSSTRDSMLRLRLGDRKLERVAAFENIGGLALGTIVAWIGIAPDDSPLLARDVSAQEIYRLQLGTP
jgi:Tol biopolymer transport system component